MTRLQVRRGTTTQWTTGNPILAAGEPGLDTTTGFLKIGDGITNWNTLLSAWVPASVYNSAPRGVTAAAIGSAIDGIAIAASTTVYLTSVLNFTFVATRRYRVWFTIRALTAGGLRMGITNNTVAFNTDQYFSSDRSYDGASFYWFITGTAGAYGLQIISYSGTAGATLYGKDFYVEDVGGT